MEESLKKIYWSHFLRMRQYHPLGMNEMNQAKYMNIYWSSLVLWARLRELTGLRLPSLLGAEDYKRAFETIGKFLKNYQKQYKGVLLPPPIRNNTDYSFKGRKWPQREE